MIGKIINIYDNFVEVELTSENNQTKNLINFHVAFEIENFIIIGEVLTQTANNAKILLIGEINNNIFYPGISKKPFFNASCRIINANELNLLVNNAKNKSMNIGTMPQYNNYKVNIDVESFFNSHFSILGNTGSGKSYGVARIIQNLFSDNNNLPINSNIFIFDAYGEYHNALKFLNNNPKTNFKIFTTKVSNFEDVEQEVLRIPLWLLNVEDYALLLNASKASQLAIIEKSLKLVNIFSKEESEVLAYKNDIIAKALLEILYSGGTPMQIRDQLFAVLTYFNTSELNLESKVAIPGWIRTLRQCLIIDKDGKIHEIQLVADYLKKFVNDDLELPSYKNTFYNLKNLKDAFEFALISEGLLKSNKVYDDYNALRVRLHELLNSDYKEFFNFSEYITAEDYIKYLTTNKMKEKIQVVNFNINFVTDRFAKTLVKLISKILFEYSVRLENRASVPFHIILEEAHRYVQQDEDLDIIGYNIFERITKEGRKYGIILGMISQRPSEISDTAISQCNNFLIFRMQHPKDLEYIKQMVPNVTEEIVSKFKILQPGSFMAFGSAFKIPILLKMQMPNPEPNSQNVNINKIWFEDNK